MKKSIPVLLSVFLLLIIFTACKKSDTTPPVTYPLEGTWTGSSNNGIGGPVTYFSINFKAGNMVRVEANNPTTPDIATGTWMLTGNTVTATYSYTGSPNTYTLAATYNSSSNLLSGTIGAGSNTTGQGVFTVNRQ